MKAKDSKYCSCLYYSANALSRVIGKMAEEEFAVTGIAPSYAFLLMSINSKPGIQPTELASHMSLQRSTVSRLMDKMEAKGFIQRKSEGRSIFVYPTQKSLDLNQSLKKSWQSLYKRYTSILGEDLAKKLTSDIYQAYSLLENPPD